MTALTIVKPAILADLACLLLSESFHLEVAVGVVTEGCVTKISSRGQNGRTSTFLG